MADVEMSRQELVTKLLELAFQVLKPCGYDLHTLAVFLLSCEKQFGITEGEKIDITTRLTGKVMSDVNGNGRRSTD